MFLCKLSNTAEICGANFSEIAWDDNLAFMNPADMQVTARYSSSLLRLCWPAFGHDMQIPSEASLHKCGILEPSLSGHFDALL